MLWRQDASLNFPLEGENQAVLGSMAGAAAARHRLMAVSLSLCACVSLSVCLCVSLSVRARARMCGRDIGGSECGRKRERERERAESRGSPVSGQRC